MGPPQPVSVQAGLRNLGPIALMKARDGGPWRIVVALWNVSAIWRRDLDGARADQVVIFEQWELAGQPGLIPSPESHFRYHYIAWAIRLQGCIKQQAGVPRPIASCWATLKDEMLVSRFGRLLTGAAGQ